MSPHGTNARYHAGCRCDDCREGARVYEDRRRRQMAYGRWEPYVDAEPVRRHVRSLMAPKVGSSAGIGWIRIAELAGVATSTVWKLLYGDPQRGQPPSRRCRPETAARLMRVTGEQLAPGATVAAGPTMRLIAELVAGGFCRAELARYLSGDPSRTYLAVGRGREVQVRTADAVADLHRRWSAGLIVPRGRRRQGEHGPPSPFPAVPGAPACEDCGAQPWADGRWCWDCYQTHRRAA